jgi:hypothetical protein
MTKKESAALSRLAIAYKRAYQLDRAFRRLLALIPEADDIWHGLASDATCIERHLAVAIDSMQTGFYHNPLAVSRQPTRVARDEQDWGNAGIPRSS